MNTFTRMLIYVYASATGNVVTDAEVLYSSNSIMFTVVHGDTEIYPCVTFQDFEALMEESPIVDYVNEKYSETLALNHTSVEFVEQERKVHKIDVGDLSPEEVNVLFDNLMYFIKKV